MSKKVPNLPGYSTHIDTRTNFAKAHLFDIKNGLPITDISRSVNLEPGFKINTDAEALLVNPIPEHLRKPDYNVRPAENEGLIKVTESDPENHPGAVLNFTTLPDWVKFDRKVLRYYAYFIEAIYDSPVEKMRVRQCRIYFYLEDNSIHIEEFMYNNSGIPQGRFLERSQIVHRDEDGEPQSLGATDFIVGSQITIYGRDFNVYDADEATRAFVKENYGIELEPAYDVPVDDWNKAALETLKKVEMNDAGDIRSFVECSLGKPLKSQLEKTKKFLANDRKVLKFWCTWNDPTLYGEKRKFTLNYFLADDTIEIAEIHKPNSGRDSFPKLISRCRLPKVPPPVGSAKIGKDSSDKVEYYSHADLRVGSYIDAYARRFLITKADEYTVRFYMEAHGLVESDFEPIVQKESILVRPKNVPPPHNGYGTEQDSLGSCHSLVPKPPRKDFARLLKYDKTAMRFLGKYVDPKPEHVDRRFVFQFFLADDTMSIYEQQSRNSGFVGGKYLDRCKVRSGFTDKWYTAEDFFVGAKLKVNGQQFDIFEADEMTLKLMENENEVFTRSNVDVILRELADKLWDASHSRTNTFLNIDQDGDNTLTVDEFGEMCKKWGWNLDPHQKITIFRKFDTDGSGTITFPEFFKSLEKFKFCAAARGNIGKH